MNTKREGVRSLARGLEILKEINSAGSTRAGVIAQRLGLARPTVYRLLETLEETGFVAKCASDDRYRITHEAARFFNRYTASPMIGAAAQAAFSEIGGRCVWPLHLSTFENGAMVIQLTNHSRNPFSTSRSVLGRRLPLLRSAAGKAYLASCNDLQREEIVSQMRARKESDDFAALNDFDRTVSETSTLGYAVSDDDGLDAQTSSIATGVTCDGSAFGSLTAVYMRGALDSEEATTDLLDFVRQAATNIGSRLTGSAYGLAVIPGCAP